MSQKPFERMTTDQQIDYLLNKLSNTRYFCRSNPAFDREFLKKLQNTIPASPQDMRYVLNDIYLYFEENPKQAARYRNLRRHFQYRLEKFIANRKFITRKYGKKTDPPRKPSPKLWYCDRCGKGTASTICPTCNQQLERNS